MESAGAKAVNSVVNRSAIITGAGRGIGRAAAVELHRLGYALALVSRTQAQLEQTRALLDGSTPVLLLPTDVSQSSACSEVVRSAADTFGRLDALVHCAGVAPALAIEHLSDEQWRQILDTNLSSAFYLARAAIPLLGRGGGGVIVNISSPAAVDPFPGFAAYGAAKAGLNVLTRMLAREGARDNIRAHAISPAATETAMFRALLTAEQYPPEKTLTPEDVARVIGHCVTGELRYASGEVISLSKEPR